MTDLFHAYIVSGTREEARTTVNDLLAPYHLFRKNSADYIVQECVTFSIDNARELRAWQDLAASDGEIKTYIVYADFITREAENALLKTFEEPTPGTHIILSVPNHGVLLPTLLSRVRLIESSNTNGVTSDAQKFLALGIGERMEFISKLLEKGDDDDASALVRQRTLALLTGIEQFFSKDAQVNQKKLESILKFKKYLQISGASSRMILETLSLTF